MAFYDDDMQERLVMRCYKDELKKSNGEHYQVLNKTLDVLVSEDSSFEKFGCKNETEFLSKAREIINRNIFGMKG